MRPMCVRQSLTSKGAREERKRRIEHKWGHHRENDRRMDAGAPRQCSDQRQREAKKVTAAIAHED